jgi:hypothetical protein
MTRQRRRRTVGYVILIATPILLALALRSFGMDWIVAVGLALLCDVVALVRIRLKWGSWPWQSVH